ncbi:15867_t:CDS:2, partial [Gigaspora margarita]
RVLDKGSFEQRAIAVREMLEHKNGDTRFAVSGVGKIFRKSDMTDDSTMVNGNWNLIDKA